MPINEKTTKKFTYTNKMLSVKVLGFLAIFAVCYAAPNAHKLSNKGLRLDGGVDAKEGQFPFQASIQWCLFSFCEHVCGGTILSENWILTGAGCVGSAHKVIVGSVKLHEPTADTQTVKVAKSFAHSGFPEDGLGPNDIALLKLETPLIFNANVQAAKLPVQGQVFNGTANASGYGESFLPDFNRLQAVVDLTLVSNDECNSAIKALVEEESPLDATSNICTLNDKANVCDGDIGSPLSQNGVVIGTMTWFITPCSTKGAPNVYTNVANFVTWINQVMADNS